MYLGILGWATLGGCRLCKRRCRHGCAGEEDPSGFECSFTGDFSGLASVLGICFFISDVSLNFWALLNLPGMFSQLLKQISRSSNSTSLRSKVL